MRQDASVKIVGWWLLLLSLPLPGVEFKGLKGGSHQAYREFFTGKRNVEDSFLHSLGNWLDDRLPEGFWEIKDPKKAALAMIEANRSEIHRKHYDIGFRDDEALPKSGWLYFHFGSSSCYSYSSRDVLLGFGDSGPSMLVVESNSPGVVGHNPWADLSGSQAFEVPLTTDELAFASRVLLWLGRLEAREIGDPPNQGFGSSTADGFVTLDIHENGKAPRQAIAGTAWVSGSIKARWVGNFMGSEDAIASLMDLFIEKGLSEKWQRPEPISAHSLMTLAEDRIKARVSAETIELTGRLLKRIFAMDRESELPARFLQSCLEVTGNHGLVELRSDLQKMRSTIPEKADPEEKELERLLERGLRNPDPFNSNGEDGEIEDELLDKLQFHRGHTLREVLNRSLRKLEMIGNEEALVAEVQNEGDLIQWALGTLARDHRDAWIAEMFQQFREARDPESRKMIFETLTAVGRETGRLLISTLDAKLYQELLLEIATFRKMNEPEKLAGMYSGLLELLGDENLKDYQKEQVYLLLAGMRLDGGFAKKRRQLILKMFKSSPSWLSAETRFQGFLELAPEPGDLEFLWSEQMFPELDVELGIKLIFSRVDIPDERRIHMERFMEHQIAHRVSDMDELAKICLAFDLRKFAPEMKKLATSGPEEEEGKRFHSARFLTAMWLEEDGETLAKMWIDWMTTQAWYFGDDHFPMFELKKRFRKVVQKLSSTERARWIEEALTYQSVSAFETESVQWLRSLK